MRKKHPIDSHTILQRNPEQLYTVIDDEVVMLSIEHEEYLNLNPQASYIWQHLDAPRSLGELADHLCSVYNVDKMVCIQDTLEFITPLVEMDIIQIIHEKST